jgi:dephospho-CoA kinase
VVRVALTGGIATGKSGVLRYLQSRGVPTIDADVLAREAVAPGSAGLAAVQARFGPSILARDGTLDRRALAALVFADPSARADLEAIVHPAVYKAIADWFERQPVSAPVAVADIPLLFETGRAGDFDRVVVAACPVAEQIRRAMARDGISEADARARVAAQWPIAEKVARADHVIWTTGSVVETQGEIDRVLSLLSAGG